MPLIIKRRACSPNTFLIAVVSFPSFSRVPVLSALGTTVAALKVQLEPNFPPKARAST